MAERKLHKHHRLLAAAGAVLDNLLQQCVGKGDVSSTLPLQLWIEQKEVYLEDSRRTAIALLENTILVCLWTACVVQNYSPSCPSFVICPVFVIAGARNCKDRFATECSAFEQALHTIACSDLSLGVP